MDGLDHALWQQARAFVLERDRHRCTAADWDPQPCSDRLHVHHVDPETETPYDPDGLITLCGAHHTLIHHLMRKNERLLTL